jgi:hypothetical protein
MALTSVSTAAFVFAEDDTALIIGQLRADTSQSYVDVLNDLFPPLRSVRVHPAGHAAGRRVGCVLTPLSVVVGLTVKPDFYHRCGSGGLLGL